MTFINHVFVLDYWLQFNIAYLPAHTFVQLQNTCVVTTFDSHFFAIIPCDVY